MPFGGGGQQPHAARSVVNQDEHATNRLIASLRMHAPDDTWMRTQCQPDDILTEASLRAVRNRIWRSSGEHSR